MDYDVTIRFNVADEKLLIDGQREVLAADLGNKAKAIQRIVDVDDALEAIVSRGETKARYGKGYEIEEISCVDRFDPLTIRVSSSMAAAGAEAFHYDERFQFLTDALVDVYRAMEQQRRLEDAEELLRRHAAE